MKYAMTVTMTDGTVRNFAPPFRPVLCDYISSKTTDVIDAETGEVLVAHGEWERVDVPLEKIEMDLSKPLRIGALAELRDGLNITV